VRSPKTARAARPGTFAHLRCGDAVPLRRPLSIMRTAAEDGWVEFLYKPIGPGLDRLAERRPGDRVSLLGPIGNGFRLASGARQVFAIGGGVGIPPMVFLAQEARAGGRDCQLRLLFGSEVPFPFDLVESALPMPGMPSDATHAPALLEQGGIPARLASRSALAGSHAGFVTDLARACLNAVEPGDAQIVACGPEPMLEAAARLAAEFELPCQLAVEEFMACGVGGCAGCTVPIRTADGEAMKRVCVDGPVFEAREIYPQYFDA
jgi:dihydroorotate dehydrogenase electron transfer subunit